MPSKIRILFYNISMKTFIITLIILLIYTIPALAAEKTTKFYSKTGKYEYKVVEKDKNFSIYKPNGERVGYGEITKNGTIIYDTKGNKVLQTR